MKKLFAFFVTALLMLCSIAAVMPHSTQMDSTNAPDIPVITSTADDCGFLMNVDVKWFESGGIQTENVGHCWQVSACILVSGSGGEYARVKIYEHQLYGGGDVTHYDSLVYPGTGCVGGTGFFAHPDSDITVAVTNYGADVQVQVDAVD